MTSDQDDWQCFPYASRIQAEEARHSSITSEACTNPGPLTPKSIGYITTQLKAAADYRASTISKKVMIDLERRLERKERCQGFGTFLVGFLLLNCIERMCWVFQQVNNGVKGLEWPLEKPVDHYLRQATRFAEFLSKLYKMRGILLSVHPVGDDGTLHTNPIFAPLAEQWLDDLKLTNERLKERREASFDISNHRCFDFRLCSQLLHVET